MSECDLSDCYDTAFCTPALLAFDRAIDLRPNHPTAWQEKGKLLVQMKAGREVEAREALMRAVNLDPRDSRAWLWMGAAESKLGELVAARECYDRAVSLELGIRCIAEDEYAIPAELRDLFFAGAASILARSPAEPPSWPIDMNKDDDSAAG